MTTFSYSGNDWDGVINRAVLGRPECKFTNCERLQLQLRDKRNQLQRLEDIASQLEGDIRATERAIRQDLFGVIKNSVYTLGNLVIVLAAVGRFRAIILSLKRLLSRNEFTANDVAGLVAEIIGLNTAVDAVESGLRVLESNQELDDLKRQANLLSRETGRVANQIEKTANELERDCLSNMRNVG